MAARWRKRLISAGVVVLVAVLAVSAAVWWAATRVPDWYRPPVVRPDDRHRIQQSSFQAAAQINNPMRGRTPYAVTLEQEQVNRWLAMPDAVVPDLYLRDLTDRLPANLQQPMLIFQDGKVTLAARIVDRGRPAVVSVTLRPELMGDRLKLTLTAVRIGKLPVPLGLIRRYLARNRDALPGGSRAVQVAGQLVAGMTIPNEFVWPNGKRRFRLTELSARDGELRIGIEPGRVRRHRR